MARPPFRTRWAQCPGGFAAFKARNLEDFGGRLWHDDYLFRDGARNPIDAASAVNFWRGYGLVAEASKIIPLRKARV